MLIYFIKNYSPASLSSQIIKWKVKQKMKNEKLQNSIEKFEHIVLAIITLELWETITNQNKIVFSLQNFIDTFKSFFERKISNLFNLLRYNRLISSTFIKYKINYPILPSLHKPSMVLFITLLLTVYEPDKKCGKA